MFKKSLISVIVATALAGCGGDDNAQLDGNSRGSIEITGSDLFAGGELSALATDADGIQADTLVYVWSTGTIGTTYTITEADEGSPISVSANYTDNAGFTEGVGASTEEIKPTFNVSASIVKGPVEGATCEIFEVNANGEAILPQQADAPSDALGNVLFTDAHIANNGLLSCTGGSYIDESTGLTLDAPLMRSVVKVVDDIVETDDEGNETVTVAPVYVISPLTEIVVQNTEANFNNFDEVAESINARFGIRFDTTEVAPTVVGTDSLGADGAENSDRYGSVLALISQLDADNTDADISTVITDLSTDIADGDFADSLDIFETAQTNLQTTSEVASFVDSNLLDIIGASVGYNDTQVVAIIEGDLSGTARNTAEENFTGTLTVIDPNFNEDSFIEQTDVALIYGTFSISSDGVWTYTVNTENEILAALEVGASVNDPVTVQSADGTTAQIDIRVAALTQVVEITNTDDDTGEILFRVENLRQGKLSASFLKEVAIGSDGNSKDAYIKLGGSSGSNSESLIDLRIQGDQTSIDANGTETPIAPRLFVRNTDSDIYPGDSLIEDFNENQFYDIDITWDLDAVEQVTVMLDGEVIFGGSFSTPAVVDSDFENLDQWFADGIQTIQFRFGDNGTTIPFGSYFIDNIELFSDTAGTDTASVFSDDFEGYTLGDDLSDTTSPYTTSVYAEVAVFDAGDGTVEQTPAVFFDLGGAIASDEASVTGAISVQDINEGEASITAATIVGTYGTFNIEVDGSWTYTLDTNNATIAALIVGERETDTFTITSSDGTTAEFNVLINGTIVVATGANNVAVMSDTTTTADAELRLTTDALAEGSISTTIKLQAISGFTATPDVSEDNTAYISVYGGSASSSNLTGEIIFSNGAIKYRDASKDQQTITGLTYADDTDIDVVLEWSATGYSVSIDGGTTFFGPYVAINTGTATETYQVRIGSSGKESAKELLADEIVVADAAGTAILTENFETFADGEDLSTSYSSSAESTVRTIAGTEVNLVAVMSDTTTTADAELRLTTDALAEGSISTTIKLQAISGFTATPDVSEDNTAYISVYGGSASSSNLTGEIIFSNGAIKYRDASKDQQTITGLTYADDTDIDVVLEWSTTGYSVSIDGGTTFFGPYVAINTGTATETYQVRIGSSGKESAKELLADEIVVADAAGTAILTENFENFAVNDDLSTTYSSSAEATVQEQ
ncbi:VCBS domain-containing protein [Pseudocolwellia sp. HL-MZ19]|uniref:VCBS domain-containing protein n=1 Tax=unclassified Pseudocolwellia TaxID=2848178 RepID=UPI003CF1F9B3